MNRLEGVREFLHDEASGALALFAATIAALIWANSPAGDGYVSLWLTEAHVGPLHLDLRHWVNDGLMALFFFVVGLEIKREVVTGELKDRRTAALPALAAVGGVLLPALVFVAIVGGGEGAAGWAIPAATDIAFAVGVLALLGDRVSDGVRLLLLSIAIVDDILAIAIIALVYAEDTSFAWMAVSAGLLIAVVVMRRVGVVRIAPYIPLGIACWIAIHESGIHATVAGVVLGLMTPAHPVGGRNVIKLLEHRLHLVTAFVVVPLFALANAGIDLGGGVLGDALGSPLAWGIFAGLVAGKLLGVGGAALAAVRSGAGSLPDEVQPGDLAGIGALAGVGFTVSLFIASLAFDDPALVDIAKVAIFAGSLFSAALGAGILIRRSGRRAATGSRGRGVAQPPD